jgi:tRNA uridine 5-carbamoylmethylation protein Kti12
MNSLYIIIGAYGSGKSEYSVHLARKLNSQGKTVSLVDLDVVNPYFRSRDVKDEFSRMGIEVVAPEGQFRHADLPMISPRIKAVIEDRHRNVILDVGGDPAGCRALGRFVESITNRGYEMLLVINTNRPFTSNPEEILTMHEVLEFASKLKISEYICNTNLMEYTNPENVNEGISIIQSVAQQTQVRFDKYLVLNRYSDLIPDGIGNKVREVMTYTLSKPWEIR